MFISCLEHERSKFINMTDEQRLSLVDYSQKYMYNKRKEEFPNEDFFFTIQSGEVVVMIEADGKFINASYVSNDRY